MNGEAHRIPMVTRRTVCWLFDRRTDGERKRNNKPREASSGSILQIEGAADFETKDDEDFDRVYVFYPPIFDCLERLNNQDKCTTFEIIVRIKRNSFRSCADSKKTGAAWNIFVGHSSISAMLDIVSMVIADFRHE
jgi:hypothetical protein